MPELWHYLRNHSANRRNPLERMRPIDTLIQWISMVIPKLYQF
jgi:hypothetical protein